MDLFLPITKVEVTEAGTPKYSRGTTAFIAYVSGNGYANILSYRIIVTRIGKKGKDRIAAYQIHAPAVNFVRFSERETEIIKGQQGCRKGIWAEGIKCDCEFEKSPIAKDIMEMEIHDFFGYISALAYHNALLTGNGVGSARIADPFRFVEQQDLGDMDPKNIMNNLIWAYNMDDDYKGLGAVDKFKNFYNLKPNRAKTVEVLQKNRVALGRRTSKSRDSLKDQVRIITLNIDELLRGE